MALYANIFYHTTFSQSHFAVLFLFGHIVLTLLMLCFDIQYTKFDLLLRKFCHSVNLDVR